MGLLVSWLRLMRALVLLAAVAAVLSVVLHGVAAVECSAAKVNIVEVRTLIASLTPVGKLLASSPPLHRPLVLSDLALLVFAKSVSRRWTDSC